MKLRSIIAATLMTAALVTANSFGAFAQDKKCCPEGGQQQQCQQGGGGKGCQMPDLTAEQLKQIETLKTAMMKDAMALKNQIAEKKAHIKTLSTVDEPNMAEINKTIDEMFVLKADLEKKKAAHMQAIRKVLTPEQRLMFDMKHAGGEGCGDGPGHGKGGGQGCAPQGAGQGCQQQGGGQGCAPQGAGQGCQQKAGCGPQGAGQGCQQKAGCQQQQGAGQGCAPQGSGQGCQDKATGAGQGQGCGQKGAGAGQGQGCQQHQGKK